MTSPYLLQPCRSRQYIARKCAEAAREQDDLADALQDIDPEKAEEHRRAAHRYLVAICRLQQKRPVRLA